ncbi:DUF7573 domain-containing protein [Haloarcula sp. GH36]|uniref:DUF7573 domain-containing protein n=1 Tax=Haloarcula montana TaxID=3111776 RepID=UPI002D785479|nr:hypothetical protein [Haloarcula sp. GH36]
MAEDVSLDEFLHDDESAESPAEDATGSDPTSDDGTATDRGESDAIEPATTTYAWSDDGAACAACGTVVERRWQQDGSLVCPACKEW